MKATPVLRALNSHEPYRSFYKGWAPIRKFHSILHLIPFWKEFPFNTRLVSEGNLPVLIIPYHSVAIFFFQRAEPHIDRPNVSEPTCATAHTESRNSLPWWRWLVIIVGFVRLCTGEVDENLERKRTSSNHENGRLKRTEWSLLRYLG